MSGIGSAMIDAPSSAGSATRTGPGRRSASAGAARAARRRDSCWHRPSPSKRTVPDVGSSSRSTQPPGRRLPAARLPHQPERLAPRRPRSSTPATACTTPDAAAEEPGADREVLHQVLDLEDRCLGGRGVGLAPDGVTAARSRRGARRHALGRRAGPRRPGSTRRGGPGAPRSRRAPGVPRGTGRSRTGSAGCERAAGRQEDERRRLPVDRLQRLAAGRRSRRGSDASSPRVYGWRGS